MALSFSENAKMTIGENVLKTYVVTADAAGTTTIEASDLDLHYIETIAVAQGGDLEIIEDSNEAGLINAAGVTTVLTFTAGGALGDYTVCAVSADLTDMLMTSYIQTATKGEIRIQNESGNTNTLGLVSFKVRVPKNIGFSTNHGTYVVFAPALANGDTFNLWVIGW